MHSKISVIASMMFNLLFILSSISCLAQANEQQSKITESDDDSDDTVVAIAGANAPDSSFISYLSSSSLASNHETSFVCLINSPYEVRRFELKCDEAEYLDVTLADCCLEGDTWQATAKVWDEKPNKAIVVTPSKDNEKSAVARVYNNGGAEANLKQLTALIECRYKSGINQFPAASLFTTTSDGYCTVKDLGVKISM